MTADLEITQLKSTDDIGWPVFFSAIEKIIVKFKCLLHLIFALNINLCVNRPSF